MKIAKYKDFLVSRGKGRGRKHLGSIKGVGVGVGVPYLGYSGDRRGIAIFEFPSRYGLKGWGGALTVFSVRAS